MELWKSELDKLNKSGRTWAKSTDYLPYRCAELFCEECGKSLGRFDIVTTNLETYMYCANCVKKIYQRYTYYTFLWCCQKGLWYIYYIGIQ